MRTLLLADDNVTVQRVIALTFAQEPVRVVTASDGHQAMDRVVVERPDIVLAGTTLPQVNGYELARFVRSKAEMRNVPVLLLSGAFETVDEALLKASGAAGVIEKPVEPISMISRVKELLGLKAESAASTTGRLVTPAASAPDPAPAAAPADDHAVAHPSRVGEPASTDPLESAYDTLDRHMAGQGSAAQRNPAPPLTRSVAPGDPRSPGRPPAPEQLGETGNPVYEVDETWFSDSTPREPAPDTREMADEPRARERGAVDATSRLTGGYQADDPWFVEDEKAREAREIEQTQLAAEMGIHEVQQPPAPASDIAETTVSSDEQPASVAARQPIEPVKPAEPMESEKLIERVVTVEPSETEFEPVPRTLPIDWFAKSDSRKGPSAPGPQDLRTTVPGRVADDFAQLLGYEQGEHSKPPIIEPVIHAVTPEITPQMLDQIASTVADRLRDNVRVEPKAPEITAEMIKALSELVSGELHTHIRIEPVPPVITPEMIAHISERVAAQLKDAIHVEPKAPDLNEGMLNHIAAFVAGRLQETLRVEARPPEINEGMLQYVGGTVADRLRDSVRVEARAPEINDGMLQYIAGSVADRLRDSVRVEARAPELNDGMLQYIAGTVADRLRDNVRVEARAPEINDGMLQYIAGNVADRLRDSVRVEPKAPELTDEMLGRVAENVAARLKDNIRVEPAIPELNSSMLDQIAGTVTTRLTATVEGSVTGTVQALMATVRETIVEVVKTSAVPPPLTNEMLDHVAWSVADRVTKAMPAPAPPVAPQITDEMIAAVAGRVADRLEGDFSIESLKASIVASVRDTVRTVVAETSERLVREEIERIKAKAH